ncbi:GerAB/ArcD/ProY family transporter [Clostridium fungisolvens]|uniref:Spore germination protein YndE n=1 Tax=Clostridium fungisolvens TaxID=1604897 RepID=A0A6V8SD54_9CLOT|nr:endospore germination permease [Clostridium fungisolvens]GFP74616.1 Spore germination protein YndE [Clostridium fungisolvens]
MNKISNFQLFALVAFYQIGTTVIFGFSSEAGRAAWISVLICTLIGLLINYIYLKLYSLNPGLSLVEWYPNQFGKWLGTPISWMYTIQFLYVGGRIIGDLRSLIPNTLLPNTPHIVTSLVLILVASYAVFSGIEVIGRLGELFIPFISIISILIVVLIFSSDIIHLQYLKPFLGKGWKDIWKAVFPLGITQTFGQSIELAMIYPFVNNKNKLTRTVLIATLLSGIFISALDFFAVAVLGETIFSRSIFPMFRLVRLIKIGEFIQNLDALNVLLFLTTAFFKICIHLYSGVRGIQQLTYTKSHRIFVIPAAAIILYLGMSMASNSTEHIEAGLKIMPYNLWLLLFYILPIILFIVSLIRKKLSIDKC